MIRFESLERLGLRAAALSDKSDGDCSGKAASTAPRRVFIERCGGVYDHYLSPWQVHGDEVIAVTEADRGRRVDADGFFTMTPSLPIGVTVADCVPVWLYAPGAGTGAVVHAGRAGTFKRISANAVAKMASGGALPDDIHAVIGPSAGPCCYEVSEAIAAEFSAAGWPVHGRYLDLWETNRLQLEAAGVPRAQIEITRRCTICDGAFYSFRADNTACRNLALMIL